MVKLTGPNSISQLELPLTHPMIGALAALSSAFLWAVSAILYRKIGDHLSALAINFGKGLVAILCLGALVLPNGLTSFSATSLAILALSGLIGISLGDTFYFYALMRLGPRLTLLVGTLIPVCTALIAVTVLQERIRALGWLGLSLTIAGVSYVLWVRTPQESTLVQWRSGMIFGLAFVFANALAIILIKIGLEELPALEATLVRQSWALAGLAFWGVATRSLLHWVTPLKDPRLLGWLVVAAFIGAFLGTWLSIVAIKYTQATVAAALNSTSPLFVLPLVGLFLKERVSWQAVLGASVAVCGIAVYFVSLG